MFWSDLGQTRYGKIVVFLGSKFSRHPEGVRFMGLQSEFSRSLLSRHHDGCGRWRINNSSSYAAVLKKTCRSHDCSRIVGSQKLLHEKPFQESAAIRFAKYHYSFHKVQIISQSTDSHFAKYRFSFRKVQISISQSADFISFRIKVPLRKVQ